MLKTHYVFLVDESGSMQKSIWAKMFNSDMSLWDIVMMCFKSFCAGAKQTMGPDDLISIIGFSLNIESVLRYDKLAPAQAEYIKEWKPVRGLTYLAPALSRARNLSKETPDHRIVYLAMTDGILDDL